MADLNDLRRRQARLRHQLHFDDARSTRGNGQAARCRSRTRPSHRHRRYASDSFSRRRVPSETGDRQATAFCPGVFNVAMTSGVTDRLKNGSSSHAGGFAYANDDISRVRVAACCHVPFVFISAMVASSTGLSRMLCASASNPAFHQALRIFQIKNMRRRPSARACALRR